MLLTISAFLLPPLFVFGVYHLLTWFNILRINQRTYWKRVALASATSHFLLFTGFLVFSYLEAAGAPFGPFLFDRSSFWRLMTIFDTAPMLVILAVFSAMVRAEINPPGVLMLALTITYVVGTLQWFLVGGAIGALLERLWAGLKRDDEEDEEWL
jgi:hypothetical protein